MADNVQTADGLISTDEVTLDTILVQIQRVKTGFGPDGSYTDVSDTNPFPVLEKKPSARTAVAITKNDTTTFAATRGLYVGTGGDVAVEMAGGGTITFKNVAAGSLMPISVTKVLATGTVATDFVGLYD